jgi:hypothetical protein
LLPSAFRTSQINNANVRFNSSSDIASTLFCILCSDPQNDHFLRQHHGRQPNAWYGDAKTFNKKYNTTYDLSLAAGSEY